MDLIRDVEDKDKLGQLAGIHKKHIAALGEIVREYGGTPVQHAGGMAIAESAKVMLAGLVGDRMVLAAMRSNEKQTEAAYQEAMAHEGIPLDVRTIIERNLAEESSYHAWLVRRVDELPPSL